MSVRSAFWRLASPYDAYIAHVSRLDGALRQIQFLVQRALGYEAGLQSSVRIVPGTGDAQARAERFRHAVAAASQGMSDAEFEEFLSHVGGGAAVEVEADRARAFGRLAAVTDALQRHFATAGHELSILDERHYSPDSAAVSRLLRENRIPARTLDEYRHMLRELGSRVGQRVG